MDIAATLRRAIAATGEPHNAIAVRAGVDRQRVAALMGGKEITTETASKLAAALGLDLTRRKSKR